MENLIDPFVSMIGQPVPTVEPQALVDCWDGCHRVWQVQKPRVERSRLERIAIIYRTQILTTILKGAQPDDFAYETAASIPLLWPDSAYQVRLARAPQPNAPFWWKVYRRVVPKLTRQLSHRDRPAPSF